MRAADRLIIAFDMPTLREALTVGRQLRGAARYAKIGSILFTAAGPEAIAKFKALGFEVFLDLKFHDIPSTVEKSCRAAAAHGVALLTVHASGQAEMLQAAASGARAGARGRARPKVLGVTVLTSVGGVPARKVVQLAMDAKRAGVDGVVASPHEAALIRRRAGKRFLIVCPGIRPSGGEHADQRRVATPAAALAAGADLLVVGRPITGASTPRDAARHIVMEMEDQGWH
jgi:orotidine-5'-phosphate decarboxylase